MFWILWVLDFCVFFVFFSKLFKVSQFSIDLENSRAKPLHRFFCNHGVVFVVDKGEKVRVSVRLGTLVEN